MVRPDGHRVVRKDRQVVPGPLNWPVVSARARPDKGGLHGLGTGPPLSLSLAATSLSVPPTGRPMPLRRLPRPSSEPPADVPLPLRCRPSPPSAMASPAPPLRRATPSASPSPAFTVVGAWQVAAPADRRSTTRREVLTRPPPVAATTAVAPRRRAPPCPTVPPCSVARHAPSLRRAVVVPAHRHVGAMRHGTAGRAPPCRATPCSCRACGTVTIYCQPAVANEMSKTVFISVNTPIWFLNSTLAQLIFLLRTWNTCIANSKTNRQNKIDATFS